MARSTAGRRTRTSGPGRSHTTRVSLDGMGDEMPNGHAQDSDRGRRLCRPREGRVLGGVCAALAGSLGIEPGVVRIGAAVLGLVSGGAAVLAYLVAWALIPQEPAGTAGPDASGGGDTDRSRPGRADVRAAWRAAGGELRTLASDLRPAARPADASPTGGRSPVTAVDAALTAVGERLRDPTVRETARRAANRLGNAVDVSVGAVGRGTRQPGDVPGPAESEHDG